MRTSSFFSALVLSMLFVQVAVSAEPQDKKDLATQLEAATRHATAQSYQLRYKWTQGETIRWKVVHLATTEVTIQGTTQTSKVRTVSTKVWQVRRIDPNGNATFVHSVANINAWQKVSDRQEVRYDSATDKVPPPEFAMAAKTIGVPIATVTLTPAGRVVERDHDAPKMDLGLGGIALPLPVEPVALGAEWSVPNEIRVRTEAGQGKRIKTRMVYTLKSVKTGVATIGVETQILTPVDDARVKSQLIQQMTRGEFKFDIDTGRVLSRQIDWDETLVGFQGDNSLMKYLARFTEQLLPPPSTADNSTKTTR